MARPAWFAPLVFAAFTAGAFGGAALAAVLAAPATTLASDLVLHAPKVTPGLRQFESGGSALERTLNATVPWEYHGAKPARYLLTLLVSDDATFDHIVGTASRDIAPSPVASAGTTTIVAHVTGGSVVRWGLSAAPIDSASVPPAAIEGTVSLR